MSRSSANNLINEGDLVYDMTSNRVNCIYTDQWSSG